MSFFKSRTFIFCLIAAILLTLIPTLIAAFGGTDLLRSALGTVAKPFTFCASSVANAFNGFVDVFTEYDDLKAENEALKEQLAEYEDKVYNEELLKEVWINLIDNAVKFSPRGGVLGIKIEPRDSELAVSVSNSAPEIPESERESIFNKFYKLDESHSSEGNGIGLAIVKKIVELHKGRIDISCIDGVISFTVSLPCTAN